MSQSTEGEREGRVLGEEHKPLKDVFIRSLVDSTYSNHQGHFSLRVRAKGDTLFCRRVGYASFVLPVSSSGVERDWTIQMNPQTERLETVVIRGLGASREDSEWGGVYVSKYALEERHMGQDLSFSLEQFSPSLVISSQSGNRFGNYGGVRLRGLGEESISLSIDGISLADALDQGFYFSNFSDIAQSLSSAQITRGIGRSHYGTASYAGAIHLQGPDLFDGERYVELHGAGGSYGSGKGSLEAKLVSKNGRLAGYTRLSLVGSEGFRYESGSQSWSIMSSLGYRHRRHFFKALFLSGNTKNQMAYRPEPEAFLQQDPRSNEQNPEGEAKDSFSQSLFALSHHIQLSFSSIKERFFAYTLYAGRLEGGFPFGFNDAQGDYFQIDYDIINGRIGGFAHLHYALYGSHSIELGAHSYGFWRENREFSGVQNGGGSRQASYADRSTKEEVSGFVRYVYAPDRWNVWVDGQVRYTGIRLHADAAYSPREALFLPTWRYVFFNPKVGASVEIDDLWTLYLRTGLSHREPTRNDFLGDTQLNEGVVQALLSEEIPKPEQVVDVNIGFRGQGSGWEGEITGFYMDFSNQILPIGRYIPEHFAQLRQNVPRSYRLGIELNGKGRGKGPFWGRIYWQGHVSWMRSRIARYSVTGSAEVFENVEVALSPNYVGYLRLGIDLLPPLSLWMAGQGQTRAALLPVTRERSYLDPFLIAHAGILYESRFLSAAITLHNLFDKAYALHGEANVSDIGGSTRALLRQAGRYVMATLRMRWEWNKQR